MGYEKRHKVNGWNLNWDQESCWVGQDSEYADMGNPNGDLYETKWWCTAIKDGYIFTHFHKFDSERDLIAFWQRIENTAEEEWNPAESLHWTVAFDPTKEHKGYGSEYHRLNYDEYEEGLMDDEERYYRYGR